MTFRISMPGLTFNLTVYSRLQQLRLDLSKPGRCFGGSKLQGINPLHSHIGINVLDLSMCVSINALKCTTEVRTEDINAKTSRA